MPGVEKLRDVGKVEARSRIRIRIGSAFWSPWIRIRVCISIQIPSFFSPFFHGKKTHFGENQVLVPNPHIFHTLDPDPHEKDADQKPLVEEVIGNREAQTECLIQIL